MTHVRTAMAVIGLAGALASPAFGGTVLKNVTDWPGAYPVIGYYGNPTQDRGKFYGTAVQRARRPNTAIFRMTPTSESHLKWRTEIIYDFGSQDMTHKDEVYNAASGIYFDNDHRLYGLADHDCDRDRRCESLFTLQPPTSGVGAWTRSIVWEFTNDKRISYSYGIAFDGKGNLFGVGGDQYGGCPNGSKYM